MMNFQNIIPLLTYMCEAIKNVHEKDDVVVCWSLTSLCHSNGHIETMPAREIHDKDEDVDSSTEILESYNPLFQGRK